jgi:polysaccharide biosynthesis transport protein
VLVSSAGPGEGKTTFTAMLGRTAARRGQRVLVVDCDFLRPALHRTLGLSPNINSFWRTTTIPPLSVPGEGGLDILTASPICKDFREEFYRQNIPDFLSRLTVDYDLVLLDTPPVLAVADAKILAPFADTVVLVVKWRSTSVAAVAAAIDELHESRSDSIKVALSHVDLAQYASYNYSSYPKAAVYSYSQYHPYG